MPAEPCGLTVDSAFAIFEFMSSGTRAINWNNRGIGQIPWQVDIDYFGFIRPMKPVEFRRLVQPGVSRVGTVDFLAPKIAAGEPIAPPVLLVDWDDQQKTWRIYGHEGRSRSRCAPDDLDMPVCIIPRGIRSRHLTSEMRAAGFIPEPL